MSYVEDDIKAALVTAGYTGSTIRKKEWDEDHTIVIVAGGGSGIITSTSTLRKPKVQIQVRATAATAAAEQTAETAIWAIINLFHQSTSISNCTGAVWDTREPDRWRDDNGRAIYSAEFDVFKVLS